MAKSFLTPGVSAPNGGTIAAPSGSILQDSPAVVVNEPKDLTRTVIAVIPVNGSVPVLAPGDFVFVKAVTPASSPTLATYSAVPPIRLKPDTGPEIVCDRRGQYFRFSRKFAQIQVSYPAGVVSSGLSVQVELVIGFGNFTEPTEQRISPFFSERTITRPANVIAYAANQYVGNTADLGGKCLSFLDVFRIGSRYSRITRAMIRKNSATTANAQFSLYLFQIPPTTTATDQTVFAMTFASDYPAMGRIQFPTFITAGAGSTMAICDLAGIDVHLRQLEGNYQESAIYGALVADAAYTPASGESFIVGLWGEQLG